MNNRVLVAAFDGADRQIIDDLGLDNLYQSEYGGIDNDTDVFSRMTTELFVSFITGETYEAHGVKGLGTWDNKFVHDFEKFAENYKALRKFKGLRKSLLKRFTPFNPAGYSKEDYPQQTLFEKIDNSYCLDVPGYEGTMQNGNFLLKKRGLDAAVKQQNAINDYKQRELLNLIEKDYDFVMAHFHKIDHFHHWFWEIGDEEKAKETYREADEYAGKLKEKALDNGFDYVIFMSDHGLPTESQHNKNAFYSCNRKLFGDKTPHITDFHDKILEIVGSEESEKEVKSGEDEYSDEDEEQVKKRLEELGYM